MWDHILLEESISSKAGHYCLSWLAPGVVNLATFTFVTDILRTEKANPCPHFEGCIAACFWDWEDYSACFMANCHLFAFVSQWHWNTRCLQIPDPTSILVIFTGRPSPRIIPASLGSKCIKSLWQSDADATLISNWSLVGTGIGILFTQIELVSLEYWAARWSWGILRLSSESPFSFSVILNMFPMPVFNTVLRFASKDPENHIQNRVNTPYKRRNISLK